MSLTKRESDCLKLIAQGKTNRQIANELELKEKTIRNYLQVLYPKIQVRNRTEAMRYYVQTSSQT